MEEGLAELIEEELSDLFNQLANNHRTIVRSSLALISRKTQLILMDPSNADRHRETIKHALATLEADAVLASFQVANSIRLALAKIISKLFELGLTALA